jgi:3,4-dihydroxy 2-butanone 4-phosphate synthase/GTP cyclohydrolase II
MSTHTVEEAIEDIRAGKMVILVDDEDRENEGDLTMAAEKVTPEAINFMAKYGRGLICLTLTEVEAERLKLSMMVPENSAPLGTAFTVSIDAKTGVSTGISAQDRAQTILLAVDPASKPEQFTRPGHVFPLRARKGGVLVRSGQTEGSVDLARLAGLHPSGVICEVMREDGAMARMEDLKKFSKQHDVKIITIADLIKYRLYKERLIHRVAQTVLPTPYGDFTAYAYQNEVDSSTHVALVCGKIDPEVPALLHPPDFVGFQVMSLQEDPLWVPVGRIQIENISQEGPGVEDLDRLPPFHRRFRRAKAETLLPLKKTDVLS